MEIEVRLLGMKELNARLEELDALGQKKLLSRVMRRVAKPTALAAKSNLTRFRRSGSLGSAIGVYAARARSKEVVRFQVGAQKKNRTALFVHNAFYHRRLKGIFYGHLLEFGHRIGTAETGWLRKGRRRKGAGGSSVGRVGAKRWLTPAVDSTKHRMTAAIRDEMQRGLDAIARRRDQKKANTESLVPP